MELITQIALMFLGASIGIFLLAICLPLFEWLLNKIWDWWYRVLK
jgi:hypothetical protein